MGRDTDSEETGDKHSELEKSASPEICQKWSQLVFKIYERMIHSSEVSFFISSPQIISSLGFIIATCDPKGIDSFLKSFQFGNDEINIEYVVEHTLKFVHKWSGEFRSLVSPGQYHRARRVYSHPKFVNPHKENIFMLFCKFRVEEKIFEGPKDVQNWTARTLKTKFSPNQRALNVWQWDQTHFDQMRQQRMAEELSTKVRSKGHKNKKSVFPKKALLPVISSDPESIKSINGQNEEDRKSPILVWTSHVTVEIPDEFFDGNYIYTWNRREYLRIHESPAVAIRVLKGKLDFNTVMFPTQNHQLWMLVFYGYDSKLCSLETMKHFVSTHSTSKGPCIIRKNTANDLSSKKSIYMPNWKVKDFPASRIAQHVVASVNLHSLFVSGGFGDLAVTGGVPSATGDPKKISHLQHYGLLSFRNSPNEKSLKTIGSEKIHNNSKMKKKMKRQYEETTCIPLNERNANEIEMIPYPICVVLWDRHRDLPAYMGKITGEMTTNGRKGYCVEEKDIANKARKQRKKWWFC